MDEYKKIHRLMETMDKKELEALALETFIEDTWKINRNYLLILYGAVILNFLMFMYKLLALLS